MTARRSRSLYLDIQATQDPLHWERGIPRYAAMHAAALVDRPGTVSRLALNPFLGPPRSLPPRYRASPLLCWNTAAELSRARRDGPIAYHLMSPLHIWPSLEATFPFAALTPDDILVVTMYDAVPLLEPDEYLRTRFTRSSVRSRFDVLRSADLVLTLSRSGAAELVELLDLDPSQVAAIGGGVDPFFTSPESGGDAERVLRSTVPALTRPYVMCVTHHYERKNTEALLRGFGLLPAALRHQQQVVLVGSLEGPWQQRFRDTAHAAGIDDDQILLTGRVTDETLRALYQRARLFVAPSLSEGWGLPVAEAIACGCPAITSNTSALPEVLDFPLSTFDPRDPASLASVMERALEDNQFRSRLAAAGRERADDHTWDAVAERTLSAIAGVEHRRARYRPAAAATVRPRRRIAFAGRVAPSGTSEDGYNAALVAHLGAHADVDVYLPGDAPPQLSDPLPGAAGTYPLAALRVTRSPYAYDAVVHSLGSGPESREHLAATAGAPGIVWLHGAELALPAPAPPSRAGALIPAEHRPRPHPSLVAGARLVLVDWEADQRLIRLGRAAGTVAVEALPLGIDPADSLDRESPPDTVAILLGATPDDDFTVSWLDALLAPEAQRAGMRAVLIGASARAASSFAAREPFIVGEQTVIGLAAGDDLGTLREALQRAQVVVDATTDACSSSMLTRTALSVGRRMVTRRSAVAQLGAAFVRVMGNDDDPLDVLLAEQNAPPPPRYGCSVADVVERLLDVIDRRFIRGSAA